MESGPGVDSAVHGHFMTTFNPCGWVGLCSEACVTVTACPPTVTVPVRLAPLVLRDSEQVTEALPVPLVVPTVIQLAEDCAVHAQVGALAVSDTVNAPSGPAATIEVGDRLKLQGGGAAAWLTV
jgi:hypothetical protein